MTESGGQARCTARTKQDRPCRSFALPDRDTCIMHSPDLAGKVEAARRRGGTTWARLRILQGKRAKLDSAASLVRFTSTLLQDTLAGSLDPAIAKVLFYGISVQRQLIEVGDLAERLERLEAGLLEPEPRKRGDRWA